MMEQDRRKWIEGADFACELITSARRNREWDGLDDLARFLGIADDPEKQGAWEALVEELSRAQV